MTVSILPQQYFLNRIGGDRVDVSVMVSPGESPATYEPKPDQLAALSQSEAYFSIGVPFEQTWMDRITAVNHDMLVVDTAAGIKRMPMIVGHDHPEGGDREIENLDPHIWLSPELVKVQSANMYQALSELDPEHEPEYKDNLDNFMLDIDALESDIHSSLNGVDDRSFMVFHPSWGYFARDFGLDMIPIELGGQEPSAAELAELIREAQDMGIQVVFTQPEFSTKSAETIADEIGGDVLLISTLSPDWLTNMRTVADAFADALDQ